MIGLNHLSSILSALKQKFVEKNEYIQKTDEFSKQIDNIDATLNKHDKNFNKFGNFFEGISYKLSEVENDISDIEKTRPTSDEIHSDFFKKIDVTKNTFEKGEDARVLDIFNWENDYHDNDTNILITSNQISIHNYVKNTSTCLVEDVAGSIEKATSSKNYRYLGSVFSRERSSPFNNNQSLSIFYAVQIETEAKIFGFHLKGLPHSPTIISKIADGNFCENLNDSYLLSDLNLVTTARGNQLYGAFLQSKKLNMFACEWEEKEEITKLNNFVSASLEADGLLDMVGDKNFHLAYYTGDVEDTYKIYTCEIENFDFSEDISISNIFQKNKLPYPGVDRLQQFIFTKDLDCIAGSANIDKKYACRLYFSKKGTETWNEISSKVYEDEPFFYSKGMNALYFYEYERYPGYAEVYNCSTQKREKLVPARSSGSSLTVAGNNQSGYCFYRKATPPTLSIPIIRCDARSYDGIHWSKYDFINEEHGAELSSMLGRNNSSFLKETATINSDSAGDSDSSGSDSGSGTTYEEGTGIDIIDSGTGTKIISIEPNSITSEQVASIAIDKIIQNSDTTFIINGGSIDG